MQTSHWYDIVSNYDSKEMNIRKSHSKSDEGQEIQKFTVKS